MGPPVNLDAQLKRYFPLIICALIGIAAYFQASAIGSLISASIGGEPEVMGSAALPAPPADTASDAAPILERNPFDSSADPIDAEAQPEGIEPEPEEGGVGPCGSGRVVLIAQNDDPEWAFAAIEEAAGKAALRRVGDKFGAFELVSLAWDRVYLRENGKRCFLSMGKPGPEAAADEDASSGEIEKISDTEYSLDRATMDAVMGADAQLLNGVRMTPVRRGDRVTALKLGVVRVDSRVHELGLRSRDELQTMNGVELTSPDKLFEAYESMQASTRITLRIRRGGAPQTITYQIR